MDGERFDRSQEITMSKISFVYFDVGGVVLLDYSGTNKWIEMQRGLGISPEKESQFEEIWSRFSKEVCIDRDVEVYVPLLREELGLDIPASYSMLKDFVSRYDPNPSIWPVIEQIHQTTKLGLLTNMYPGLLNAIYDRGDLITSRDWDVTVDSSVVNAQKPDPKIFQIAQSLVDCPPEEILFVENQQKHLDAAQKFGWQTFLYDPKDPVKSSDLLKHYLYSGKVSAKLV